MKQEWFDILEVKSEEEIDNISDEKWAYISSYKKLPEKFIEKFQDEVWWVNISCYQTLSEEFIEKFQDKINWYYISIKQKLSEEFIKKFQDRVDWHYISMYQKLSEEFIEKFQDKVDWYYISSCQKLSEKFIEKFQDKVDWKYISMYQKLSPKFMKKYNLQKPENNWLYATKAQKMKAIKKCEKYEINGDYIIAYKSTRIDGVSCFNSQYIYKVGETYESNCDCNFDTENSFGLSAWTKEGAFNYYSNGELYKVKIHIDDIGVLVQKSNKIRCFKLEVIEKIDF